jgi:hypothetical protein
MKNVTLSLYYIPTAVGEHTIDVVYQGVTLHSYPVTVDNLVVEILKRPPKSGTPVGCEVEVEFKFVNEKNGER